MDDNPNPILVAVGDDTADAALAYAAAEAAREGCGVHLLHVVHPLPQGPETVLVDSVDLELAGRQVLDGALERATDLVTDGTTVTTQLSFGGVVHSLVTAAEETGARMVVLQHRALSRLHRVVTRSVTSGVAAHARVPVVSVPAGWGPDRDATGIVTVGVDVPDRSREVLLAGARVAAGRGSELRVLHTVDVGHTYFEALMTPVEVQEWMAADTASIQRAVDELEPELTGVPVKVETFRALPADALLEASASTDLLVVGRHDPVVPMGSHLGPVARAVLREASCPVLLADPRPVDRWWRPGA